MRPYVFAVTAALLLFSTDAGHAQRRQARREGWHNDYETAKELARKTGKPLMVVFRCEP